MPACNFKLVLCCTRPISESMPDYSLNWIMQLKKFAPESLPAFVLNHLSSLFQRFYLVTVNSYKNIFSHNPS